MVINSRKLKNMIKAWGKIHLLCIDCTRRRAGNKIMLRQIEGKFFNYLKNLTTPR
jgi:hypothetical protein